ncbi:CATRA system-associated protein [Streptomyces sp. NPDC051217]|uniref:CATRA system-associated protein n=1 Tax=Streptomyces sp. NPDC051217 TaxID=3365644 RepID=UPI0037B12CA2
MERQIPFMAQGVLEDVLVWRLKRENWDVVGRNLAAVELAIKAGNLPALRLAVANIEMAGPHRIVGLEDCSMLPLPQEYRERVNELIHSLGAMSSESPRTTAGQAPGTTPVSPAPNPDA